MAIAMKAAGPLVGVQSDPQVDAGYESLGLEALRPHFTEYLKEAKMLPVRQPFPLPENVTSMEPETVAIMHEIPAQLEPALQFGAFLRGVALVANLVEPDYIPGIRDFMRDEVATRVSNGEGLPAIDAEFAKSVREAERIVFGNNEPISWSRLLAFTWGAYWLLSYVQAPKRRRGKTSPLDWLESIVRHYGQLAFLPE